MSSHVHLLKLTEAQALKLLGNDAALAFIREGNTTKLMSGAFVYAVPNGKKWKYILGGTKDQVREAKELMTHGGPL